MKVFDGGERANDADFLNAQCSQYCAKVAASAKANTCCFVSKGSCFVKPGGQVTATPAVDQKFGAASMCQYIQPTTTTTATANKNKQRPTTQQSSGLNLLPFTIGDAVVIHGLVSAPQYNGEYVAYDVMCVCVFVPFFLLIEKMTFWCVGNVRDCWQSAGRFGSDCEKSGSV